MSDASLGLRIIAIPAIMLASLGGVAMPSICSRFFKDRTNPERQLSYHHVVKLLAALGTGCVIATGMCHIGPDAQADLEKVSKFPIVYAIATVVIVILYCVERELTFMVERRTLGVIDEQQEREHGCGQVQRCPPQYGGVDRHDSRKSLTAAKDEETPLVNPSDELERMKVSLVTHILEAGVAVHSILIGVSLGLLKTDRTIQPLFIALLFHQFCEGAAIGAAVLESRLTLCHTAVMWAIFVLTTPLGVSIGVGIEQHQGSNGDSSVPVQGVLNSIALGILLFMGLNDMLPGLFNMHGCGIDHGHGHGHGHKNKTVYLPWWYRAMIYFLLAIGAAAMIILAHWA